MIDETAAEEAWVVDILTAHGADEAAFGFAKSRFTGAPRFARRCRRSSTEGWRPPPPSGWRDWSPKPGSRPVRRPRTGGSNGPVRGPRIGAASA